MNARQRRTAGRRAASLIRAAMVMVPGEPEPWYVWTISRNYMRATVVQSHYAPRRNYRFIATARLRPAP